MQRAKTIQDSSISNFMFVITPTQAYFNHPNQHKRTLSLQKGMQTLGTLQQSIPIIKKQHSPLTHKFQQGIGNITFRVINEKNLNYQWTVYKVYDGGQLQEIDCMQFSIFNFWKTYIGEYDRFVASLNIKTKDQKDHKKILETWKQINEQSKQKTAHLRVTFPKADFRLDFQIQAKSILDEQLEEYEKQKLLRKLRQIQKSQIRKSTITGSNGGVFQDQFTNQQIHLYEKIRRARTQEQNKLNIPSNTLSPLNKKFLLPLKQRKQQIKKIPSNNQLSINRQKTGQDGHQSLQISSDLHKSLKKISSFEQRQSLKQVQKEQNLQLSSKIKLQKLKSPQGSKIQSRAQSIKVIIFYIILGAVMLWLMYNLMHHQSRVEYRKR